MSLGSSTGDISYPGHVGHMHAYMTGTKPDMEDPPRGIMSWLKMYEAPMSATLFSAAHSPSRVPDNPGLYIGNKSDYAGFLTTSNAIRAFSTAISGMDDISWVDEFDTIVVADVSDVITDASADGASEALSIIVAADIAAAVIAENVPISDVVQTYDDSLENQYNDALRRFNTGMAFANAIGSSNFAIGRAMIESVRGKEVNVFEAGLKRQAYQEALNLHNSIRSKIARSISQSRTRLSIQGADTMVKVLLSKVGFEGDLSNIWMESNMQLNQARVDYTERNLEHVIEKTLWPLRLYQYVVPFQSPGGGMGYEAGRLTRAQSALSGAAAVAAMGAAAGGEKHALLGAGIGAALGGAAGWYGY